MFIDDTLKIAILNFVVHTKVVHTKVLPVSSVLNTSVVITGFYLFNWFYILVVIDNNMLSV